MCEADIPLQNSLVPDLLDSNGQICLMVFTQVEDVNTDRRTVRDGYCNRPIDHHDVTYLQFIVTFVFIFGFDFVIRNPCHPCQRLL